MTDLSTRSYWLGLDDYTPGPPLDRDATVDVAIAGAGFTGLWTAYLLLKQSPGLRVALLEANAVGYGASGRNGGFAMTLVHRSLADLAKQVGDAKARDVYLAAHRAVANVTETAQKESIGCDLQPNGLTIVSNSPPQDALIREEVETATRLGLEKDFVYLERAEARERVHSDQIRCGFREEACTLLNPARLARGLADRVRSLGGTIYEGTPVLGWEERDGGVAVRTPDGSVAADRMLAAGNAYGTAWKPTRSSLLPFYTYICLTRPLTDAEWEQVGWDGREGVEDRRGSLHYFRPTIDGRILWGGRDPAFHPDGPKARYDNDERIFARLRESFEWFFPQLREVSFEHSWGGPIAVSADFTPSVGWLDGKRQRVAYAQGYNGHGVSITNLSAHALVDLFSGTKSEWTDLCFVGCAPLPLGPGFIRNRLVRRNIRAMIEADDTGRSARLPWLVRTLNRVIGSGPRRRS